LVFAQLPCRWSGFAAFAGGADITIGNAVMRARRDSRRGAMSPARRENGAIALRYGRCD